MSSRRENDALFEATARGQSTANTSQHPWALHAAGLVTREREGTSVRYSPAGDDPREVDAIGRDELVTRLCKVEAVLIDVRPAEELEAAHIKGARSIPIDERQDRLAELPADRDLVAYRRGPFCAYACDAVRSLRAAGRQARCLEEGWPEWRLARQPSKRHRAA